MNFLNGAMGEKRYELNGDSGRGITIACVGVLDEEHDEGPRTAVKIREQVTWGIYPGEVNESGGQMQ